MPGRQQRRTGAKFSSSFFGVLQVIHTAACSGKYYGIIHVTTHRHQHTQPSPAQPATRRPTTALSARGAGIYPLGRELLTALQGCQGCPVAPGGRGDVTVTVAREGIPAGRSSRPMGMSVREVTVYHFFYCSMAGCLHEIYRICRSAADMLLLGAGGRATFASRLSFPLFSRRRQRAKDDLAESLSRRRVVSVVSPPFSPA